MIRNQNGRAEWINVNKGASDGELIEVSGKLNAGDMVVRRATDEIKEGTAITIEITDVKDRKEAYR